MIVVRALASAELSRADRDGLRRLFDAAWPDGAFSEDDWDHAMGGRHWLLDVEGRIVSHAAVVERELHVAGRPLRAGYLEAVATHPSHERRGHGSRVVSEATAFVRDAFPLGALSSGEPAFYERLGWTRWRGPTFVRTVAGLLRTADEDDGILVLRTPNTPDLDLAAAISCEWRPGDVW